MNAWDRISTTVVAEFSDLPDLEALTQVVVRLLVAAVLGGVLGLQREYHGKEAGVRTHMLVAIGSALFVLVPVQAGADADGLSRVIQGVVAGVGFLCAGTILKVAGSGEEQVRGLTTAAGIWLTAAIGIAVGLGREMTGVLCTVLALAVLALEGPVRRLAGHRARDNAPGD
jgi:putative Mg2+ transporter-C (MgtC) family protein